MRITQKSFKSGAVLEGKTEGFFNLNYSHRAKAKLQHSFLPVLRAGGMSSLL